MSRLGLLSFVVIIALEILALTGLVIKDGWHDAASRARQQDNAQLVQTCLITDLALWTEARYTRHPSQADCFTAFQDGPATPDHFPSGTWLLQPACRKQRDPSSARNR